MSENAYFRLNEKIMKEEPYLRFSCKDGKFLNCDELLAEKITGEIDDVDTDEPQNG